MRTPAGRLRFRLPFEPAAGRVDEDVLERRLAERDRLDVVGKAQDEVPQQLHLDLTVADRAELDAVHRRVLELGGVLRLDRSDDPEEPLRVYADPDGHPFCVFV